MAQVTGIGGIFFRASDPAGLAEWYVIHLGIPAGSTPWDQAAGPTVFAPFPADSDYFPASRQYMLNFRVDDLPALITALADAGIPCETRAEREGPYGSFARIHDPEGSLIELWQPATA